MTDDNVIQGPWKTHVKLPEMSETNQLRYNLMFAEDITQSIITQALRVLDENKVSDRQKDVFIKDFGLVNETLKSCILRHFGFFHPMQLVSDMAMTSIVNEQTQKVYSQFDLSQLNNKEFDLTPYGEE